MLQQVIYVDVLVILNLIITFFLLLATELFTKEKGKRWRVFLGALAGGIYSLQVFLPEMGTLLNILTRVIAGTAITYISFGFKTHKRFIKLCLVFLAVTFLFAGLMIGLWIVFTPSGMLINNSVVYFGISLPVLIVSTAVCYVISLVFSKILMRNKPQTTICDFVLEIDGKKAEGRAMLDTGNNLCESFSGYPVVICTYDFLEKIIPDSSKEFFKGNVTAINSEDTWQRRKRLVPYSTVTEKGMLPAFRPDKLILKNSTQTDKVFVAVINYKKHINESFDMLLNPNLF